MLRWPSFAPSFQMIRIEDRLAVLVWDGTITPVEATERLFHRLPIANALFNEDAEETEYLRITMPNQSITRDGGGQFIPPDALLEIDKEGFRGVKEQHGVIEMRLKHFEVQGLTSDIKVKGVGTVTRHYRFVVEHVPYPENAAHAEVRAYEVDENGVESSDGEPLEKLPKGVDRRFRKKVDEYWEKTYMEGGVDPVLIGAADLPVFA